MEDRFFFFYYNDVEPSLLKLIKVKDNDRDKIIDRFKIFKEDV